MSILNRLLYAQIASSIKAHSVPSIQDDPARVRVLGRSALISAITSKHCNITGVKA